ncbi:hypothetical protein Hanom_Chr14g01275001 [Helianthus anomalus]
MFRAFGIEPIVGDFRRFYQLTVSMSFYSFRQRDGTTKLMVPPKGMTKWKTKFFYIKAVAITAKLQFRNVTDQIITENISVPRVNTVDWIPDLRIIGWVKLNNTQLWVLQMMLGRMSRNARPVVREKSGEDAPLWRMFFPNFKGKVVVLAYEDGEEGFNRTIRNNFRVPDQAALKVELPQGKGKLTWDLGALGDPAAAGVPKQTVQKMGDKRFRKPKKPHKLVVFPPLVPEVAGSAAAGGSLVGVKPADDKKRKGDAPVAGGQKGPKLRRTRTTAIPQPKPTVTTGKIIICYTSVAIPDVADRCSLFCVETREEPVSVFATPLSSPKVAGVETQKEDRRSPTIEVVSPPSVHVENPAKKPAVQTIDDTLDSSNNLIDPHDVENRGGGGGKPKSPVVEKPKSPLLRNRSPPLLRRLLV